MEQLVIRSYRNSIDLRMRNSNDDSNVDSSTKKKKRKKEHSDRQMLEYVNIDQSHMVVILLLHRTHCRGSRGGKLHQGKISTVQ